MFSKLYCSLELSKTTSIEINNFFKDWGLNEKCLFNTHHLTIYEIPILKHEVLTNNEDRLQSILSHQLKNHYASVETRFMVMSPGGDNPNNKKSVHHSKVGIRITKRSPLFDEIDSLRQKLSFLDQQAFPLTSSITGRNNNAYGIKEYKPHVTLINRNNNLPNNLFTIGAAFREHISELIFSEIKLEVK